ncbi:MAG: hypothetical protein IKV56_00045 [Kiritimatiellae bacterium]|nr:hypothetical protein [Kiritimatiellia bacterium]
MSISVSEIGAKLYSVGNADGLTFAEMIAAVSVRTAAAYEAASLAKMNMMSFSAEKIRRISGCISAIASGTLTDWESERAFLEIEVGVANLPEKLDGHPARIAAIDAIKASLDALTHKAQEDMIDMQTLINRRDMVFNVSSSVVRVTGLSKMNTAAHLR